jgi:hypothetical protein
VKAQGEDRTTEGSVKLCQKGIEHVHRVHRRDSISSSERRSVEREDKISENSVKLCQEGIEKMHRMH